LDGPRCEMSAWVSGFVNISPLVHPHPVLEKPFLFQVPQDSGNGPAVDRVRGEQGGAATRSGRGTLRPDNFHEEVLEIAEDGWRR
jgi:hypothetical protein